MKFLKKMFKGKKHKNRHKHKKYKNTQADRLKKIVDNEKDKDKRDKLIEDILNSIEMEVDKKGGVNGMDGNTVAAIMSYYLEDDNRYKKILNKVLEKRKNSKE